MEHLRPSRRIGAPTIALAYLLLSTAARGAGTVDVPVHPFDDLSGSRRIVFVLDHSGSMLNKMTEVREEVAKAIEDLAPATVFDIVMASEETKVLSPVMIPADAAGKKKGHTLLEQPTSARGVCLPLPAIQAALKLRPGRICFVTDGDVPDELEFATNVWQIMGPKPAVRIDFVLPLSRSEVHSFAALRLITHHTGGSIRCIVGDGILTERDLPRATPDDEHLKRNRPHIACAGVGSSAASAVAFVLDDSIPADLRPLAKAEVLRSIEAMGKDDRFTLIRTGSGAPPEAMSPVLVLSNPGTRARATQWLKGAAHPAVKSDAQRAPSDGPPPVGAAAAVALATGQHAESVFFLYGPDADLKVLRVKLAEMREARKGVPTYLVEVVDRRPKGPPTVTEKVDEVEFTLPIGPPDEATLLPRTVAAETGGAFTYLGPEERKSAPATRRAGADSPRAVFGDVGNVPGGRRVVFIRGAFHVMS